MSPRPEHAALVGVIRPINDPLWQQYQPGNEWNCKCDWQQTDAPSTAEPTNLPNPPKGLQGNPADTGEIISQDHPYFQGVNARNTRALEDIAILNVPDEVAYIQHETYNGGKYLVHRAMATTDAVNFPVAEALANAGYDVKLLPQVEREHIRLRARYFGREYVDNSLRAAKNPDALINGKVAEIKNPLSNLTIRENIRKGSEQANIVIVRRPQPFISPNEQARIDTSIKDLINAKSNLKEVIIIAPDGSLTIYK